MDEILLNNLRFRVIDNLKDINLYGNDALRSEIFGELYCIPILNQSNAHLIENGPHIKMESPLSYRVNCENKNILDVSGNHESNIINFSKIDNINDYFSKCDMLKTAEKNQLTSIENVSNFYINENDATAFRYFKEAINSKECDINVYKHRFLNNSFSNDIRHLKKDDKMSIKKMIDIGNALDIRISIYFEDKEPNTINPMGEKIGGYIN